MEEIQELKEFLLKVSAISEKYEVIAKETGENYNVFNILGLSTREVRTHSALIADLLNPKGSHGQGLIFLKLFLDQIKSKINFPIDKGKLKNAQTEVEKYIGLKNKDNTEGGNIDIIIEVEKNAIIIENKIYAEDQKNQLLRYYNYGKMRFNNDFLLLYLTLDGHEPSNFSLGIKENKKSQIKYVNITYKEDIKSWLEKCHKETVNQPLLRETLKQYINLVKQLTGQAMSNKVNEKIKNLITENTNIIEAIELSYNNLYELIFEIKNKFNDALNNYNKIIYENNEKHFYIKQYSGEDRDGFFIGYIIEDEKNEPGKNISNDEQFAKYRDEVKKIIIQAGYEYYSNHLHIGWFNPNLFKNKKKFEHIDKKEIINMFDDAYLDRLVKQVNEEVDIIENQIKNAFNNL